MMCRTSTFAAFASTGNFRGGAIVYCSSQVRACTKSGIRGCLRVFPWDGRETRRFFLLLFFSLGIIIYTTTNLFLMYSSASLAFIVATYSVRHRTFHLLRITYAISLFRCSFVHGTFFSAENTKLTKGRIESATRDWERALLE